MKKNVIILAGKEYPCRVTLGVMVRFKNMTGHDISKMDGNDLAEVATFLYCCVKSACAADEVAFDMSLEDFADRLNMEDAADVSKELQDIAEKKTAQSK